MTPEIEKSGFIIKISEYGDVKRQYHDTDYDRFMKTAQDMISQHLSSNSRQSGHGGKAEVKNITINIYTY